MPGFLHLMRCVAGAVVRNVPRALASLVPFGDALFEIAKDAREKFRRDRGDTDAPLRTELEGLAQASPAEVRKAAEEAASLEAAGQPDLQPALVSYLSQMQDSTRRSLRRPADPSGKTVPAGLSLKTATDLMPFLPAGLPRFKPGDRPLPGVNWELEKLLGSGGFGEVWKARNPRLTNITAALKFCLDPAAAEALLNEAENLNYVLKTGPHPGIVQLKNAYLDAEPYCLEYEFIEGDDLAGTIHAHQASRGAVTPGTATKIVLHLARTIGHLHELSPPIVHRDLKPANVLARQTRAGRTEFLITDFGIGGVAASQALEQTRRGTTSTPMLTSLKGAHTPLYASPEQKKGEPPDPRDDVHALGVIWYQMLVGDFSAEAPTGREWKKQLRARGVAEKLVDLIESCFDPRASRPPNGAILAEQIKTILSSPLSATGTTVVSSRNPAVYGQAVTLTATVNVLPPASGTPTGTITFTDGSAVLGSAALSGGAARLTVEALAAGSHAITASYGGDTLFAAGASAPLTQEVTPAPLTVTARDARKLRGEATPDFAADFSGFVGGDGEEALGGALGFTTQATGDSEPGSYAVTPGGLTSGNYSITFVNGTLTVAPSKIDPRSAEACRQRARAYLARGKLAEALAEFDKLVRLEPNNPANLVERGRAHAANGSHDKAVADFTQAIQGGARSADVFAARGTAYAGKGALDLAFADFDEALRLDPGCAAVYLHRGRAHEGSKAFDLALADYSEAIRLDPEQGQFFHARGMAYLRKGQADLALADLIRALNLDPGSVEAYHGRGQVYARKGNYDQAVGDYTQAIKLGLKSGGVYYHRGLAHARLHKAGPAIADFTKAIKASPRNAELYLMRGLAYCDRADHEAAVADFTRAIHRDKGYTAAYFNRARAYLETGKYGKAVKDFTQVIGQKPGRADAFDGRARAQLLKKQYDAAVADATEAVRLDPSRASAYAHRGRAHAGKGELGQAVADATEAIRQDPRPAYYEARGLARHQRGEYDLAAADFTEAIRLDPKNGVLYRGRGRAYARAGNTAKAEADRRKAIKLGVGAGKPPRQKAPAARGVTLADVIAAGLLVPPVKLFRRYKGATLEATLLKDGSVRFRQQRYDTCSAAAEEARATVAGRRLNTNGWTFWRYEGAGGKKFTLDHARKQLASPPRRATRRPKVEKPPDATVGARIRGRALELLSARPDGIRYAKLVRAIHDACPDIPVNTIHGNVWDLDKVLPEEVCKPARGLFRAVKFRGTGAGEAPGRELVNSLGMRFTLVPAGMFLMGSPDSEEGRGGDEGPQHEVEITRPFYLGVHPVTQKQYKRVVGGNPSHFTSRNGGGAGHPVEQVSWEEAVEFCRRLSALPEEQAAGRTYRLPTEAEWEYACRGGATSSTPFSSGGSLSSTQANFDGSHPYGGTAAGPHLQRTTPVGSYGPNAFGLYDMHGNVWEWCADWYDENYYSHSPRQDPQGPQQGESRVIRGGSCYDDGCDCRSAARDGAEPGYRGGHVGFRVVCVAPRTL
jgi:formylglycine-generating enzyme required for sulfatase activity/tetratricopeptide (TPR) repeat protein/serine/threonine protein kinase